MPLFSFAEVGRDVVPIRDAEGKLATLPAGVVVYCDFDNVLSSTEHRMRYLRTRYRTLDGSEELTNILMCNADVQLVGDIALASWVEAPTATSEEEIEVLFCRISHLRASQESEVLRFLPPTRIDPEKWIYFSRIETVGIDALVDLNGQQGIIRADNHDTPFNPTFGAITIKVLALGGEPQQGVVQVIYARRRR
ncbi:MAG: hypothetical protein JW816_01390 [Candidatus Buchananbacteria bacterium]|nr:hypothetical protein [Candidatus Buchananbacteria bacterium]